MKDTETLIFSRMTGDTGVDSLDSLLGGSSGKIRFGFQSTKPTVPQINYWLFTSGPGNLTGDFARTFEEFYQFIVYSNSHPDIIFRLKRLFDNRCFDVTSGFTQVGAVRSVWDWEGADGWDDSLEVMTKQVRFRFFTIPKAQDPI